MPKLDYLALIPARGGSKRLPRKNLLPLGGKPLINWTIEAALAAGCFSKVLVSTDCEKIAKVSRDAGAEAPFLRPKDLSGDFARSIDVLRHALRYCSEQGDKFPFVVFLQPTSPFRTAEDISNSVRLLESKAADGVISVTEVSEHPYLSNTLPDNLSMRDFLKAEIKETRTQDLPSYFKPNGAIYIGRVARLLEEDTFYLSDNIFAYLMPKQRSVDIDCEFDFKFAEFLLNSGPN
jgi:N-acylneuraminate cytidylyltransferase